MKDRYTMTPHERAEAVTKLEARLKIVDERKRLHELTKPRRLGLCTTVEEVQRLAAWKGLCREAGTLRNSLDLLRVAQRCAFDPAQGDS